MELREAAVKFTRYLQVLGRSADTVRAYTGELRRFDRFMQQRNEGPVSAQAITRRDIEAWVEHQFERGLSARTRYATVVALKSFFRFALDQEIVSQNPAAQVKPPQRPQTLPRHLDATEVRLFLERCTDPLAKTVAALAFYTGLRISELCALTVDDVNLRRGTLHVHCGKGGKDRIVPLSHRAREVVLWYLTRARPQRDATNFLLTPHGFRLRRGYAGQLIAREGQRQGWQEPITPHLFRHSSATALYQNGVDILKIATLLGHNSVNTTRIYAHVVDRDLQEAVNRLD